MSLLKAVEEIVGLGNVKTNEPMCRYNTFQVGGPAAYYVAPTSVKQLAEVVKVCKEYEQKYYIVGNGSNLIVKDCGYDGMIIHLCHNFSDYKVEGNKITAQSGIRLSKLANILAKHSLKGFEFASGIPGTLGGAVVMNAGAYGGEMSQVLDSVRVMDQNGEMIILAKDQLELGYRTSVIPRKGYIVIEAVLALEKGNEDEINALMLDYNNRRKEKQPLEFPSAGSTFKRPKGYFAGKLIQDSGLRGYRVGGAMISEKHSGFVINIGNATTADILQLIQDVKDKVYEMHGVRLEEEVKVI